MRVEALRVAGKNNHPPETERSATLRRSEGSPIDTLGEPWWLVHTKPRNEKALAADLDSRSIKYFLPLVRCKRVYAGRVLYAEIPLFSGYLFLNGGDEHRYATLLTHRAVQVIPVVDQERLKSELRQIHLATTSGRAVELYPGIREGRRCRVIRGSLAGLEGVVLRCRGAYRVYVGVDILGQSAEVEVDPSLLEPIE